MGERCESSQQGKPGRGPGADEAPGRCRWEAPWQKTYNSDYRGIDGSMERAGNMEFTHRIQGGSRTKTCLAKDVPEKKRFFFGGGRGGKGGGEEGWNFKIKISLLGRFQKAQFRHKAEKFHPRNCTCCHTETEDADQTCCLLQSQYTDCCIFHLWGHQDGLQEMMTVTLSMTCVDRSNQGPVSWRPTTIKRQQFSQSNRHSTIGTRQIEYHEALPSLVNYEVRCDCMFADDGNASWYSVCRVSMVEWRLDCENCRHLTVVCLHDTGPRYRYTTAGRWGMSMFHHPVSTL